MRFDNNVNLFSLLSGILQVRLQSACNLAFSNEGFVIINANDFYFLFSLCNARCMGILQVRLQSACNLAFSGEGFVIINANDFYFLFSLCNARCMAILQVRLQSACNLAFSDEGFVIINANDFYFLFSLSNARCMGMFRPTGCHFSSLSSRIGYRFWPWTPGFRNIYAWKLFNMNCTHHFSIQV